MSPAVHEKMLGGDQQLRVLGALPALTASAETESLAPWLSLRRRRPASLCWTVVLSCIAMSRAVSAFISSP